MATSPLPYRGSPPLQSGEQNQKWPTKGKLATSPLPSRGSPPLQSGGQNQKWPTSGHFGYLTPAISGIPTAAERGAKSEVAHKWAKWLPHPCRIGDPRRFRAGGKIRSGPQVGKLATSPLPYRGSPPLQSGGQNQKWPTSKQNGYLTPAVSGIPAASERGAKSEVARKRGKLATSPLPYRGSPALQSGGQNQKWPTCGQCGYLTHAVSGIPTASERGAKSEVAHKSENWLPHPCRIGDPRCLRAGGKIGSRPQVGKLATSPLPYRGSPPLQSGGQNQKSPTRGKIGYLPPAVSGIPAASERGAKSEVAHKRENWLPHPCRIGDPRRFRAGGKIGSGPQMGKMATSPLPYRGSPPLQSGGQNQKSPTRGKIGYLTPAVSGIPAASERGAKSEVVHKGENWLPHPCRIRGSPPLQSGGQNQGWPTSGQNGYLTPAVSGIPTASERGAKSEVAHKRENWLPQPCRLGDPRRFRAGGKIGSGPQMGKMATSPLPYRGIPAASERGAKSEVAHKWAKWLPPPCRIGDPHRFTAGGKIRSRPQEGQIGYLTPAVSGIPAASEQGAKSEVAHKWAKWLPHPCRIGDLHRFRAGDKIRSRPQEGKLATSPLPYRGSPPLQSGGQNQKWPTKGKIGYLTPAVSGDPYRFRAGGKIRSGPQVGKMATSPLPYRGSPPLQSGGQNQKSPTRGKIGYLTPAVSGIPAASEREAESEVAHKGENWLPHPCRIGDPHRFRAGGKIRNRPQEGKLATSPLPYRGAAPLQSGGQNQKWPTNGQNGYLTPAVSGDPRCFRAGGKIRSGPQVGKVATSPLPYRGSPPLQSGGQNQKSPTRGANWLPHPCRIGNPRRFRAGGKIRSGPQRGKLATSPLPSPGIPAASERGAKSEVAHKWAKWLLPPAVSGIPTASERGAKSEVAHKWANWLPHPCRIGDPHRFRAGGKIRSGPQRGKLATSPLPYRGSLPLQSGRQNQKWPTSGQNGYLTPAVSGIPAASERGAKSEVAHKWANWLPHPCRIGDPHRFRAGGKIRSRRQEGKLATSPLPYRGSPPLQSGGQNQKWPTKGKIGYLTPAVSGIPAAEERGAKSEVAHKWAKWLPHPCRIGDPRRFRAGGKIRSGPQVGKKATSPLPYRGSPPLQSGGQNQKSPTRGKIGYLTPAVSGIPAASERGAKSEVAHKWAKWLPHPCRIGGSPLVQSGGPNQKLPTSGQGGYLTPAVSGIPAASERGAKSEVAHKRENGLPHPCRIGDPRRFRAGGKIRSGPQRGKLATSPLPYRGSPPLQSGGQNQKWPTCGQRGYLTPAVSGIPAASERGAKSEVAHKRENWLPHPCRIGDPRRFRAGGKIRSGPQRGKLATSPLPYRGSLPLQSGGQNQKSPTSGQNGYLTPAVSGIPTASERGAKSEVAHKRENWLPHPCRLGDPRRFRAGGKVRSGPQMGKMATSPLPYPGIPAASERKAKSEVAHKWARWLPPPCRIGDPARFRAGGKIRSGPQEGQIGYLTPAVLGIPAASERGAKSEVAHKGEDWLPRSCRIGDPHCLIAGGKIRSGPQVGELATSPLPYRGSPPLQSGGQNQKSPTSGQIGYLTPAVSGIPASSERGAKSEVAHKRENWLPPPCRIGDPRRFRAGGKIRSRPQEGKLATSPLPYPGIPAASERGAKSEVARKWAKWLPHPCRIGDPPRFRAGGKSRSRPQEGKLATSPLPSRGSPPLQSGGQSQKWPTNGQNGYLTPAVSGDPRCFRAGGKIRSGPQVGKVATSSLPYRGSPPLQSGGQNQKSPTRGANWLPHPCRIGDPRRFRAGGKIRSGPQRGRLATSPLPYRGSPLP